MYFEMKDYKVWSLIHHFQDRPTTASYSVRCKPDQTFAYPNTWPVCVDKLDCSEPTIDSTVMTMDWTEEAGMTPPFEVK